MTVLKFADLVLYDQDDYLIINKPAGIATLADRHDARNILILARQHYANSSVCHRLDKDTSGVLALAKNQVAYRHLAIQFEKRTVDKNYVAVVQGVHNFKNETVDLPLGQSRSGIAQVDRKNGKDSQTVFTTLRTFRHFSLVECRPITGRLHQIRAHLAHLGAPIVGDPSYGGKILYLSSIKRHYRSKKYDIEQPLIRRTPLHAARLSFFDLSQNRVMIEAPFPKDFKALINQLTKYDT